MANLKTWVSAFRLRTLPLATASIALGSFLAAADGVFRWHIALLCLATAILLQILSNLANDYGDSIHGADREERVGPKRATQSGNVSVKAMKIAIIAFVLLCFGVGYLLIKGESFLFYLLGMGAIAAAIAYTAGPKPYGYAGFGDIFVFLFFGIVGVFGTYYLHTHLFNFQVMLPAISCGLFSVAVLNINNIRDIASDKLAGKNTIPVRIGANNARIYHWLLLILGVGFALAFIILNYKTLWQFLFLITLPLIIKNARAVSLQLKASDLDPYLKQMVLATLLFSFSFGLGILL